ncbi:hypothetical protein D3C85_1074620 [compost metagenome]
MRTQGGADLPVATDHVEHAGRQVGFGHQSGEFEAVVRGFFTGLDDDGVAGQQGRGHLAGNQEEGEIPRQDPGHHAQWFAEQEDVFVLAVAGDDFTFDAPCPFGHVVEVVGGEIDFDFRQPADLALFQSDGARQVRDVFPQFGSDPAQVTGAIIGRFARPAFLGGTGGGEGALDVLGGRGRDFRQHGAGGRVDHIEMGSAGHELAVDEVFVNRHG